MTYPDTYPEVIPEWKFTNVNGFSSKQLKQLDQIVQDSAQENIGMASIYMISEAILEFLRENNVPEMSLHDQMIARQKAEDPDAFKSEESEESEEEAEEAPVEKEWRGLEAKVLCPVDQRMTDEQFKTWKLNFDEWLLAEKIIIRDNVDRVTGKMFFELKRAEGGRGGDADDVDDPASTDPSISV